MKKILVIGSTVVDVIVNVDHLPVTSEDILIRGQRMSMGGCAYNVSDTVRHCGAPYILFSPVGTGAYGDFVREHLERAGVATPIPPVPRDNGCCYCFVEAGGERTFASCHGAEYAFEADWFDLIDPDGLSCAYLCGLEIEEATGGVIVDFLERHPELPVFFAPGPRFAAIRPERMKRLLALHPVLHLNREEALAAAALLAPGEAPAGSPGEAAERLHRCTGGTVIVTLGAEGCCYASDRGSGTVPGVAAVTADTIGAGDAHIGAVMAALVSGKPLRTALEYANRIAAAVVSVPGALLSDREFGAIHF